MKKFSLLLLAICLIYFSFCFAGKDYNNYDFKHSFGFDIPSGWYEFTKEEFNNFSALVSSNGGNRVSIPVTFLKHTKGNIMDYPFIVVTYANIDIESTWQDFKNGMIILDSMDSNSKVTKTNNLNNLVSIKLSKLDSNYIVNDGEQVIIELSNVSYNNGNNIQKISAMFYKDSNVVTINLYAKAGEIEDYFIDFCSIIISFDFHSDQNGNQQKITQNNNQKGEQQNNEGESDLEIFKRGLMLIIFFFGVGFLSGKG